MKNSTRFTGIIVTHHAMVRMAERDIGEDLLLEIMDTGEIRYSPDIS